MPHRPRRPWWAVDPFETAILTGLVAVVLVLLIAAEVRRQVAAIPPPGRAVPIEELRVIWAEDAREEAVRAARMNQLRSETP
jgi:hypothetical protein